ncbi:transposase [Thermodesulforhabdus norvegica]
MDYPQEIRRFICTTNQLERLMKEIKRRARVIEVFPVRRLSTKWCI